MAAKKFYNNEMAALNKPRRPEHDLFTLSASTPDKRPDGSKSLLDWLLWFYYKRFIGTGLAPDTIRMHTYGLQRFLNYFCDKVPDLDVSKWTIQLTTAFIDLQKKYGYGLNTIIRSMAPVKTFAAYCIMRGLLDWDDDPTKVNNLKAVREADVDPPKCLKLIQPDGQTFQEGKPVYDLIHATAEARSRRRKVVWWELTTRDLALLETLYYTGVRAGEIGSFQLEHMKTTPKGGIEFSKVKRKGGREGTAFLRADGTEALKRYMEGERKEILKNAKPEVAEKGRKFLFLRKNGKVLTNRDVWRIIRNLTDRALDPKKRKKGWRIEGHPHTFRHEITYALLDAGLTETVVAQHLAHASTQYVYRYARRSKRLIQDKIEGAKL